MIDSVRFFTTLFLLLIGLRPCFSQEDARLWTKVGAKKKVTQRFDIEVENCLRIGENYSRINSYYLQLGGEYEFKKGIKIGAAYRHSHRRKSSPEYHSRSRMSLWLEFDKKIGRNFSIRYRPMLSRQYTDFSTSENGHLPTEYFRNKLEIQYKTSKKINPFISVELYYRYKYNFKNFNRIRYAIGIDYFLNKHHKTTLSYQIQKRMNEPFPYTAYITSLEYCFIF